MIRKTMYTANADNDGDDENDGVHGYVDNDNDDDNEVNNKYYHFNYSSESKRK